MQTHLSRESLLLMYLAGELPEEARVRFEQLLASDAAFRAELDALREVHADVEGAIRESGGAEPPLPVSAASAARRVGEQVRSRAARAVARSSAEPSAGPRRIRRWAYVTAAAAASVAAGLALWHNLRPDAAQQRGRLVQLSPGISRTPTGGFVYPLLPAPEAAPPDVLDEVWPSSDTLADAAEADREAALSEAEDELYALSEPLADDEDVPTILLESETDAR